MRTAGHFSESCTQVLRLIFGDLTSEFHVRELERQSGLAVKTIQHELEELQALGLVTERSEGSRRLYRGNRQHVLFPVLQRLITGTTTDEGNKTLFGNPDDNKIPIKRKHSIFRQAAILECHGRKCVYTSELLSLRSMTLDHVLHHDLWRTREKLAATVLRLGLAEDFDPNGIENLILASNPANREKSNKLLDENNQRHFLNFVARKATAVRKLEKEFSEIKSRDELVIKMRALQSDDPALFDELLNSIDETGEDEDSEYMSKDTISVCRKYVSITCSMPKTLRDGDLSVSALVRLNRLTLSQAMITFGPMALYGELLRGTGLPCEPHARPWVRGDDSNSKLVCIDIAHVTCSVYRPAAEQLAEMCDKLKPELLARSLEVERKWGSLAFEPISLNQFRLVRVPMWAWELLLRFAAAHDFAKGETKWHIFNANNSLCVRTRRRPQPEVGLTLPCAIWPSPEIDYCSTLPSRDEVWLCWDRKEYDWNDLSDSAVTMNASETATWIADFLIPAAVDWYNRQLRSEKSKRQSSLFLRWFQRDDTNEIPSPKMDRVRGHDPILPLHTTENEAIHRLQQFFNARSGYVPVRLGVSIVDSFLQLLELPNVTIGHYADSKLRDDDGGTAHESLRRQRARFTASGYADGGALDYILRGMAAVIDDNDKRIGTEVRTELGSKLTDVFRWHDDELYRERLVKMAR